MPIKMHCSHLENDNKASVICKVHIPIIFRGVLELNVLYYIGRGVAWFTEIVLRKMCVYVCLFVCMHVCLYVYLFVCPHPREQSFRS